MCGIAGYQLHLPVSTSARILAMLRCMRHRGPDDEGVVFIQPLGALDMATDQTAQGVALPMLTGANTTVPPHHIAFGHRRFSIIDVTANGHQPFWSRDRRACVCFNGEIYNYLELRQELVKLGHEFSTSSDTEVLAEAYLEWGTGCFSRFNGFWALSIYDACRGQLLLARDRIGKAPLYMIEAGEGLFWGSEIKALYQALNTVSSKANDQAVVDFVQSGWRDLDNSTFYQGVVTFPAASYSWLQPNGQHEPVTYWKLPAQRLREDQIAAGEAAHQLRDHLNSAVRLRLRADVPVGFELSGGMDSSALVGLAASHSPIHAFTVSFAGSPVDEEPFARKVVEHLSNGIRYTVLKPESDDFFREADEYIWLMEEPFHSPNLLSNQRIWRSMAANGIRVSINGGAGDEVLAGYPTEFFNPYLDWLFRQRRLSQFAREHRSFSEGPTESLPGSLLRRLYRMLPEALKVRRPSTKVAPFADPFRRPSTARSRNGPSQEINQRLIDMMGNWKMNYWMRAGNKSAMGVPVEVRSPFLDFRVVEFAFSLPLTYLIRNGWMKWVLREAVKGILPSDVVWRKVKMGFPFPHAEWLSSSKARVFSMLGALDCPYLDLKKMLSSYDQICGHDPLYLWRLVCLGLWWKRCIQLERLA